METEKFKRKEDKDLILEALRSGRYKQTTGVLSKVQNGQQMYCCLGVMCELFKEKLALNTESASDGDISLTSYNGEFQILPYAVQKYLGISPTGTLEISEVPGISTSLAELNDNGYSFDEISRYIEEYL